MSDAVETRNVIRFEGSKEALEAVLAFLKTGDAAKFNQVDFDLFLPMPKEVAETAYSYFPWELAIGEYLTNHKVTFMGEIMMGVPVRSYMLDLLEPVDIVDTVFGTHTSYAELHPTEKSDEEILLKFMKKVAKEKYFDSYKKGYEVLMKYGCNGKDGWKQDRHWNYPEMYAPDTLEGLEASLKKKDDGTDTYTMKYGFTLLNCSYFGPLLEAMQKKLPHVQISVDFAAKDICAAGYAGTVSFDTEGKLKEVLVEPHTNTFKNLVDLLWDGVPSLDEEYEPD